jgi:hypothetical protein
MPDTIGELARQDLYPDERYMQPPQNAVGGLTPEDWMMSGQQPPAATYDYVPPQSWLQKAGDLARRDVATYQQGGVPAMMGQLAEDSSGEQDLAGGFGGNIKGVESKLGAIADLAPHAPPFYSAVEQAVQGAKQTTAPGQQWAGFLRNQPGVKPEELSTLKLGDLFDQTGAVTKQDLLDHIAANKVNVGEVVKGEGPKFEFGTPEEQSAATQRFQTARQAINNMPANEIGTHEWNVASAELGAAEAAMRDVVPGWGRAPDSTVSPTKFSQYTLPGGENYRETLLTLPITNVEKAKFERMTALEQKLRNPADYDAPELNALRAEYKQLADETRNVGAFQSSHFDEPNILAHIRTNDRVIDGKKTLFVEEVQSDWHQKGKREGYQEGARPTVENYTDWARRQGYSEAESNAGWNKPDNPIFAEWDKLNREQLEAASLYSRSVPDAPFKTTWPDLAMKRVIRQAAEGGYDKVAWTPGSVQAERYDLSKQISKVHLSSSPDRPSGTLIAYDMKGNRVKDHYMDNIEQELPDVIGKDVATKLLAQPPNDFKRMSYVRRGDLKVDQTDYQYHVTNPDGREVAIGKGTVGSEGEALDYAERYLNKTADEINQKRALAHMPGRELSGLDLKIGGEGMKGFYDQILPASVNKIVKKAGGRVEQAQLGGTIPQFSMEGHGPWVVRDQNGTMLRDFNNRELAEAYLKQRQADVVKQTTPRVHTLDITPQLREMALKKGFPLFTAGGLVAGGAISGSKMGDLAKQDDYQ